MDLDITTASESLTRNLAATIRLLPRRDGTIYVETPFEFADGDAYPIHLRPAKAGGVRVTDRGHTLMHLSYQMDVDSLRDGAKARAFEQVLREQGLSEESGELFVEGPMDDLAELVFRFSHALTRVADITFLNRIRTESVFYEQVRHLMERVVGADRLSSDFVPDIPDGVNYPVDFRVEATREPIFVFGIPGKDKARIVTAILEHLLRFQVSFESLLIFSNQQEIPRRDLARLTNVAGEMVSSLDAVEDFERKLRHRAA